LAAAGGDVFNFYSDSVFCPAEQSIIPLIVAEGDLLSANSLYTTTMMASVIVGFAVGEPLLALADKIMLVLGVANNGPAILVGVSYLVAGLCLMTMAPGQENLSAAHEDLSQFWADIKDGLRYLGEQVQVRVAIIQLVLLSSVFAALAVLAVRLAEMIPTIKASQFGFLLAAGGLGLGLGAVLVGNFGPRFPRRFLSLWGALGMAVCLIALAWTTKQLWASMAIIGHPWPVWCLCGHSHADPNSRKNARGNAGQGVWPAKQHGQHCPQSALGPGQCDRSAPGFS
jgi:predicted MFS family arabinose efflux permease